MDFLRYLGPLGGDPVGGTNGGLDGIEAGKAYPSNGRPVAALSKPLIHIECQGSALQSLESWLVVHLLGFGFAHLRDDDVELSPEKATCADTLE